MIIFDQLRISDDGRQMYINVHVNTVQAFAHIYIDKITIMTADKVSETDPGTPTSDYIYTKTFEGNQKEVALVLTATDFTKTWETDPNAMVFPVSDMPKTLFFVYVQCKQVGIADPCFECLPCSLQEMTTVGVTFDENMLYQKVMDYTRQLASDCNVPQGFTDFILLWNAFNASVETEHYIPAIKYYNMLFGNYSGVSGGYSSTSRCRCHG